MCEINWVLLTGIIAAVASAGNALLLFWMIRVTIRYVEANLLQVEVSRGTLVELRRQYAALVEREVRPYKNLVSRVIRNLEAIGKRDLLTSLESLNGIDWLSANSLLPSDYEEITKLAMTYDVGLYEALSNAKAEILARPMKIMSEMEKVLKSGRSTLYPEMSKLQAEFRASLIPIIAVFSSIRDEFLSEDSELVQ